MLFCMVVQESSSNVTIDGYEDVPVNDEEALLKAAANQPIAVAIEASGLDFQFYSEVCFFQTKVKKIKIKGAIKIFNKHFVNSEK